MRAAHPVSLTTVSLLLLGSGFCALVYQTVWFRAFRLVFGSSTASTAAVLALFMAGLGLGSVMLGPRADRQSRPLALYAKLELGIALLAALSPLLVPLVSTTYAALGGNQTLGLFGGTLARLALAAPIIAIPAWLMGGTLPAAARAIERGVGRRRTGWIYGFNTLGAVLGVFLTTFWALENLGMRKTCLIAALLNGLVAVIAFKLAREHDEVEVDSPPSLAAAPEARLGMRGYALLATAGLAGFAFFLLEIVWYRMLAPLLGGSTYTFGLILALALAGIGLGGLIYGASSRGAGRRPALAALAFTLVLEGLVVLAAFAAGDNLALIALGLRSFAAAGFTETVVSWALVTILVVLPTAIIAGYQFPLLIGVLGEGTGRLGREVGLAYGWNTTGAILGSLGGGFGLLPLLGAPALWRAVGLLLVAWGLVVAFAASRRLGRRRIFAYAPLVAVAIACAAAAGPTAAWRHSGIGSGRFSGDLSSPNAIRRTIQSQQAGVAWEADGRESSVALHDTTGYAFFVNGKSDGHSIGDASTQILSGLIGAALLERPPESALVIGLGTGSSAGWLGAVPGIDRVDVVELEPAILEVARACTPVNHGVFEDPRVHIEIGDAREVLSTTKRRYDLIFSEPSNPYRAGVASLFSLDFYLAAQERLSENGVLVQWLQAYEVDPDAVRTVYATLAEVFPWIETWQVSRLDMLLIASRQPLRHDLAKVAERVSREPFESALAWTWGLSGVEGLYTGFVGDQRLTELIIAQQTLLNTDDRSVLEFGFARNLGRTGLFSVDQLRELARTIPSRVGNEGPGGLPAGLDPERVSELLSSRLLLEGVNADLLSTEETTDPARATRSRARRSYQLGQVEQALEAWQEQELGPLSIWDRLLVAEGLAVRGDEAAREHIDQLRRQRPADAAALEARLLLSLGRADEAFGAWATAAAALRERPWILPALAHRHFFDLATELASLDREVGRRVFEELGQPLAVHAFEGTRKVVRLRLSGIVDPAALCLPALRDFEPYPVWDRATLTLRLTCYEAAGEEVLADRARRDLETYMADEPTPLVRSTTLAPPRPAGDQVPTAASTTDPNAAITPSAPVPGT